MNSYLNILGLAARARKIVTGETIIKKIRTKEVSLVLIATDASDNTKKKLSDKCTSYGVDYIIISTIDELSVAVGKHNRVAVGIEDKGFGLKIKEKIGR